MAIGAVIEHDAGCDWQWMSSCLRHADVTKAMHMQDEKLGRSERLLAAYHGSLCDRLDSDQLDIDQPAIGMIEGFEI